MHHHHPFHDGRFRDDPFQDERGRDDGFREGRRGRFGWRGFGRWGRDAERDCAPPRGRGPGAEDGFGFGGPRGGWFGGPRGGRFLGHGDLRLLLLALIAEKPRHGYELIRAIEERFAGAYAPSPGAVYPTLTLMEEQDLVRVEAAEAGKKLYAVTPEGEAHLARNAAAVEGMMGRIDLAARAFASHATPDVVREALRTLRESLHMRRGPWTTEEAERVRTILEKAAREIVGLPGEGA